MAEHAGDAKLVELEDGGVLNVVEVGSKSGHPLMLLHGGPGLDHHELRPWLDPLADVGFRLLYVDERGQGASPRVDPASLTMQVFAHDIDRLARALDLGAYGVLGHSFGAFIALSHALERGSADQYVISSGVATTAGLMADVEREIERVRAGLSARPDPQVVGRGAQAQDGRAGARGLGRADAVSLLGDGRRLQPLHAVRRHRLRARGAGALRRQRLRQLRVARPPALDLEADARHRRPGRPGVHRRARRRRSTARSRGRSSWWSRRRPT